MKIGWAVSELKLSVTNAQQLIFEVSYRMVSLTQGLGERKLFSRPFPVPIPVTTKI